MRWCTRRRGAWARVATGHFMFRHASIAAAPRAMGLPLQRRARQLGVGWQPADSQLGASREPAGIQLGISSQSAASQLRAARWSVGLGWEYTRGRWCRGTGLYALCPEKACRASCRPPQIVTRARVPPDG